MSKEKAKECFPLGYVLMPEYLRKQQKCEEFHAEKNEVEIKKKLTCLKYLYDFFGSQFLQLLHPLCSFRATSHIIN